MEGLRRTSRTSPLLRREGVTDPSPAPLNRALSCKECLSGGFTYEFSTECLGLRRGVCGVFVKLVLNFIKYTRGSPRRNRAGSPPKTTVGDPDLKDVAKVERLVKEKESGRNETGDPDP